MHLGVCRHSCVTENPCVRVYLTRFLISHTAPVHVNSGDQYGRTALHYASLWGPAEVTFYIPLSLSLSPTPTRTQVVTQLLISLGACARVADVNGMTPLHHAAHSADRMIVTRLLEKGAEDSYLNAMGESPAQVSHRVFPRALTIASLFSCVCIVYGTLGMCSLDSWNRFQRIFLFPAATTTTTVCCD